MRLDFDLTDERVRLGKPADDALIQKAKTDLGIQLPTRTVFRTFPNGVLPQHGAL
jgi:hypothetical protein